MKTWWDGNCSNKLINQHWFLVLFLVHSALLLKSSKKLYKNIMLGLRQLETHSKPIQIHERWLRHVYSVTPRSTSSCTLVYMVLYRWFHSAFSLGPCWEPWKSAANGGGKTLVQKSKKGTTFFDQIATKSQRRKHDHNNEMITEHNINKV